MSCQTRQLSNLLQKLTFSQHKNLQEETSLDPPPLVWQKKTFLWYIFKLKSLTLPLPKATISHLCQAAQAWQQSQANPCRLIECYSEYLEVTSYKLPQYSKCMMLWWWSLVRPQSLSSSFFVGGLDEYSSHNVGSFQSAQQQNTNNVIILYNIKFFTKKPEK